MKFLDIAIAAFLAGFIVVVLHGCAAEEIGMSSATLATASAGYDRLIVVDSVAVATDTTPVACGTTCDDNNPCTIDTCDTATGKCVKTSKGWDCWPCATDEDCSLGMVTCQGDGLIHEDGYGVCLPDKTCEVFHRTTACPDDGNPCTKEACTTEDDFVFCESTPTSGCKP